MKTLNSFKFIFLYWKKWRVCFSCADVEEWLSGKLKLIKFTITEKKSLGITPTATPPPTPMGKNMGLWKSYLMIVI